MILKLSDTEPIVGQHYLVPCLRDNEFVWPILGQKHSDAEIIGLPEVHYHRDPRFLNDHHLEHIRKVAGKRYKRYAGNIFLFNFVLVASAFRAEPIEKVMRCERVMPDFLHARRDGSLVSWFAELEEVYKAKALNCMTCPHRGTSLAGLPVRDKKVICPLHGLRWNVETGEMVSRINA